MAAIPKCYAFVWFICGAVCGIMLFWISFLDHYTLTTKLYNENMNCNELGDTRKIRRTGEIITHRISENLRPTVEYATTNNARKDSSTPQEDIYHNVRILCWIMTSPDNLDLKAIHVNATWAQRCNSVLFASDYYNKSYPTINITVPHGRNHLTAKTMQTFDFIFKHHFDDADWFLKADDDTYVIVENLRYLLEQYIASQEPVYFGHHFRPIVRQGYLSGGAGYVLSKEALRRFGERKPGACQSDGGNEDVELGKCLQQLGVKIGDSRDQHNRTRFHCFDLDMSLSGSFIPLWYYKYDFYGGATGRATVSDLPISFHYVTPQNMYVYEYLIYHLRPYGFQTVHENLNREYVNYSLITVPHLPVAVRRGEH